jgi:hypothetical protein
MGIMPHTDVAHALELVFSLDIPFWPQLPRVSFYEDMYAQLSEGFPGIAVNVPEQRVEFDTARFREELNTYARRLEDAAGFALSPRYSVVFHRFLERDLSGYTAIRGQSTGPVSFGFKIVDENLKPIIYNDEVRPLLFDFVQRKVNIQYRQLVAKNPNAFVWVDEPGLGWVFNSLSGYNDLRAKDDYRDFLSGIEGPKALHLCANVNLPYLLDLGMDILSFDAYQLGSMPRAYAEAVAGFLRRGGVLSWGVVPTDSTALSQETPVTLARRLSGYWRVISENTGIPTDLIARRALIAPARCCLKNIGAVGAEDEPAPRTGGALSSIEERLVEKAFSYIGEISRILRAEFRI